MNRNDIIRFGEQADDAADRKLNMPGEYHPDWHQVRDEAFAALVAAHEREACAQVCDKRAADYRMGFEEKYEAQACAYDIRAMGEEPKRHPGYIVGDHWLQAAYTRICTGETEAQVMADYGWQRESR